MEQCIISLRSSRTAQTIILAKNTLTLIKIIYSSRSVHHQHTMSALFMLLREYRLNMQIPPTKCSLVVIQSISRTSQQMVQS